MSSAHDPQDLPDYESGDHVAQGAFKALAIIGVFIALIIGVYLVANRDTGDTKTADPASTPTASQDTPAAPTTSEEPNPCPVTDAKPVTDPKQFDEAPSPDTAPKGTSKAVIKTSCGDIEVELFGDKAPRAVASFAFLAKEKFWENTLCHRLTTTGIFVLQCGDPTATGQGGPGYSFGPVENAPENNVYPPGTLAMARVSNKGDSNGSQFFMVYDESTIPSDTAGGYTVFGKITKGLDIVKKIADGGLAQDQTAPKRPIALEAVTLQ